MQQTKVNSKQNAKNSGLNKNACENYIRTRHRSGVMEVLPTQLTGHQAERASGKLDRIVPPHPKHALMPIYSYVVLLRYSQNAAQAQFPQNPHSRRAHGTSRRPANSTVSNPRFSPQASIISSLGDRDAARDGYDPSRQAGRVSSPYCRRCLYADAYMQMLG